jgi:hypothetical protein
VADDHPADDTGHDLPHDLVRDLKALTDILRLRVLGRLASGPASPVTLATELGIDRRALGRALARLVEAGLVEARPTRDDPDAVALRPDRVMDLGRRLDALERSAPPPTELVSPEGAALAPADARVLRAFVRDGRLISIPAQAAKREVVLTWLLDRCFPDDGPYPEKEVNARLGEVHADTASLRRYLVDTGRMARDHGLYRRVPANPG